MSAREHIVACVAMSLYRYNVSPGVRAEKLYRYFKGACLEPEELVVGVDALAWATELPAPTAIVYLQHALEKYGREAEERCKVNEII